MNIRTFFGAAVVAVCLCSAATAQERGMAALERLGHALQSAESWQADYRQEYIAAGMVSGETVAGTVVVSWPDRAIFRTGEPAIQEMGIDGRVVRLIDHELPSCDEHVIDDDEWARVPLAAVLDPSQALEHFTVLDGGNRGFILVPRELGGVDRVAVEIGEDDLPLEVVVVDPQGSTNRLHFTGWKKAQQPPDGSWLPDPPAGLECISDAR